MLDGRSFSREKVEASLLCHPYRSSHNGTGCQGHRCIRLNEKFNKLLAEVLIILKKSK